VDPNKEKDMRNLLTVVGAIVVTLVLFNEPLGFEIPAGFAHALSFGADWPTGLNR